MRTVALDIETAPAVVFAFSGFKVNIGLDQIIEDPRMMGISWQWEGEKKVHWMSEYHDTREDMLAKVHEILDEADVVIHYNGKRFDTPWILGELLVEGYPPPSPFAQIDLFQQLKSKARFFSGKLDYAARRLLDDSKVSHTGFKLWRDCLIGDDAEKAKAWALMKRYGIKDTALLFPLYNKIKGWITAGHPNRALIDGVDFGCPVCASTSVQRRGYAYTGISKFQRYQCTDCGKWFRDGTRVGTTAGRL